MQAIIPLCMYFDPFMCFCEIMWWGCSLVVLPLDYGSEDPGLKSNRGENPCDLKMPLFTQQLMSTQLAREGNQR